MLTTDTRVFSTRSIVACSFGRSGPRGATGCGTARAAASSCQVPRMAQKANQQDHDSRRTDDDESGDRRASSHLPATRTTRTEHGEESMTPEAVLPSVSRAKPLRP
jgi:hypothetical protein